MTSAAGGSQTQPGPQENLAGEGRTVLCHGRFDPTPAYSPFPGPGHWDAPAMAVRPSSPMRALIRQQHAPSPWGRIRPLGTPFSLLFPAAAQPLPDSSFVKERHPRQLRAAWVAAERMQVVTLGSLTPRGDVQLPPSPQNGLFMETNDPFPQQNLNSQPKVLGSSPLKFFSWFVWLRNMTC